MSGGATGGWLDTHTMLIETADGERTLVQKITISCELCDPMTITIAGHHIRALRRMCDDLVRMFPDLTGEEPSYADPSLKVQ